MRVKKLQILDIDGCLTVVSAHHLEEVANCVWARFAKIHPASVENLHSFEA